MPRTTPISREAALRGMFRQFVGRSGNEFAMAKLKKEPGSLLIIVRGSPDWVNEKIPDEIRERTRNLVQNQYSPNEKTIPALHSRIDLNRVYKSFKEAIFNATGITTRPNRSSRGYAVLEVIPRLNEWFEEIKYNYVNDSAYAETVENTFNEDSDWKISKTILNELKKKDARLLIIKMPEYIYFQGQFSRKQRKN